MQLHVGKTRRFIMGANLTDAGAAHGTTVWDWILPCHTFHHIHDKVRLLEAQDPGF